VKVLPAARWGQPNSAGDASTFAFGNRLIEASQSFIRLS
jgi:hypothetical protein